MCKAKIFPGVIPPDPRFTGSGEEGVERKGMKEWMREKDWGEGRIEGKRRRLGGEGREVQRGRERRGGNKRRKVGWGQGRIFHRALGARAQGPPQNGAPHSLTLY
jgi:hypothetical protein